MSPTTKSAPELYEASKAAVHRLLLKAAETAVRRHDPQAQLRYQVDVVEVEEFLSAHVHAHLLDDLFNTFPNAAAIDEGLWDAVLGFLMHPRMQRFSPLCTYPLMRSICEKRLSRMSALVVLDLCMMCTDEILQIVGLNCPSLQVINIISKVESAAPRSSGDLNALKLKLFVSDAGLDSLHNCKRLKSIMMNLHSRSNTGGRKTTHEGILRLLTHLPDLHVIFYSDVGLVLEKLDQDSPPLNLTYIHDFHVSPLHIDIMERSCPKLKTLFLKSPLALNNPQLISDSIDRLADSRILLTALHLRFFPFDHSLSKYIRLKGEHLLKFTISSSFSTAKLFLIAQHCPNLQTLEVKILYNCQEGEVLPRVPQSHAYFRHLQYLLILGSAWEPFFTLSLCLNNAKHLRTFIMSNRKNEESLDQFMLDLIRINPLPELRTWSIMTDCHFSPSVFKTLLFTFKSLQEVTIPHDSPFIAVLEELKKVYVNFNINFYTF